MSNQPYLRYPHIHRDMVAFTADDGVWLAAASGGRAWRLTHSRAPVRTPRFSADGSHLAYVSEVDGQPEIFLAEIDSGEIRRLTYWANRLTVLLGWHRDGRLLTATNAGEAHRTQVVRALDTEGSWERLPYGPVSGMAVSDSGAVVVSTQNMRPHAHWKRYRGGTAPRLWADPQGAGEWTKLLPEEPAGLVDPNFLGDTLVFTSDRAATFPDQSREQANLWVLKNWQTGDQPRQVTFQTEKEGYVRDATTDGISLTWHSRGNIWVLDHLDAVPRRLEVTLPGTAPQPVSIETTKNLRAVVPDHGADASLVSWRGKSFWLAHREGPARALSADSAVRSRDPVFIGRTGRAALITDAEGEDSLEIHTLEGSAEPQRLFTGQLGRVLHLVSDPAGDRLAAICHDGWVRLITLGDSPSVREVQHCSWGESLSPSFSPDGRYLMWSQPTAAEAQMHQLMLLDTAGDHEPVALTSGKFHDFSPAFTADGQHVVLLSNRTFDPDYDAHEFALSFRGATRPWLIPLDAAQPPPFGPTAQGWLLSGSEQQDKQPEPQAPMSPDLDPGAEERITPFPVPSDTYRELRTAKDSVLWIRQSPDAGQLGSRRAGVEDEPGGDQLIHWDLTQRKATTIVEKLNSYQVSGDGKRIVVRSAETVTVQPTKKLEEKSPERVTVDLKRLRLQIDPAAEWHQMFDETCRLMAQQYWREDLGGVKWDDVVSRWRPVVASVRSHDDLVDLLWEVVGELNTSHAYVMPAEAESGQQLGLLGADLSPAEGGWRIDRILPTESSEPDARSPLRAAGVAAAEGDLIIAVDGHPLDPVFGPAPLLVGAAGKPVELTLRREGDSRRVVVVPVADESALRYQAWVRSRHAYVLQKSGGRLGYVHVPDMMATGWAQLHRDLQQATRAEGLVADVRYNRGGHTSQLVIARLAQRVIAWARARHSQHASPYPSGAPRGPVVLVANQFSGSDGDIVNAAAQALQVGPVIGERTWGGVIGIDGRFDLVDGTGVTQPKYAFWLGGYGWGVENYGVDPDIEVVHDPGQLFREDDPQLDRAITEALSLLEKDPAVQPPELPEPRAR
ncbi:S41 family peptidase [Garicola koreensis]|uniref:S41 family peptidase n=1 Tax=Garicola koreensis TaxID=1262554 RepID=UPI0031EC466D